MNRDLQRQITDILKAPKQTKISTADTALERMTSAELEEKIRNIAILIEQDYTPNSAVERRVLEAKISQLYLFKGCLVLEDGIPQKEVTEMIHAEADRLIEPLEQQLAQLDHKK